MIETILPDAVVVEEARTDPPDVILFPEEEAALGSAVDKRRREFTTARHCAHRGLARLALAPSPIVNGPRGEPRWPAGVVGSITHCQGYRACALARATDIASLGIDAEPNEPLPAGVLADIARPQERLALGELARAASEVCWDRLLFSAKEAVYKTWFPLAERWLGFEDATLTIDPAAGTFTARLLVPGPELADGELTGLRGRWLARDGLVLTAIALAPPR
jgi:enterobactin synthetase component D / holo-[acyl-carrier protein] synthase